MRSSGPWTYAIVNTAHVLGIGALFGAVLVMDLRLLGFWRHVPIGMLASATNRVTAFGLTVALLTGAALLATKATAYAGNPFLYIKLPAIALGLINVLVLNLMPAWKAIGTREPSPPEQRRLAVIGGISLVCWLTAISAGRMIGYW